MILGGEIKSNLSHIPPNPWINFYGYYHCGLFFFVHYYIIVAALSTFPNLSNQSDSYGIEDSEIYHNNSKGDIADWFNYSSSISVLQYLAANIVSAALK